MEIVPLDEIEDTFDENVMTDRYAEFTKREGIPVHKGLFIENVNELEVGLWDRTGQYGAFAVLYGQQGVDDLQIQELEPGGETDRQQHFYEEIVFVTEGRGVTVVGEENNEITFEWEENSLFYLPKNAPYKHINSSGDSTARLVSQTSLPQLLNMIDDADFIYNSPYDFWTEHSRQEFYSAEGETGLMYEGKYGDDGPVTWESNFVPDVTSIDKLQSWARVGGTRVVFIPFSQSSSTMFAHLSEFPAGRYNPAHRHGPGANVFMRSGKEGYSLLWEEGMNKKIKVEWGERSVFTPPAGWYHHHFNLGPKPAGHLAMHAPVLGTLKEHEMFDAHKPDNIIDYVHEDSQTAEHYERELERRGRESNMPPECYTDPLFEFS